VSAARAAGTIEVTIRDTGPGVPADQLPHLFDRFYRGDASRSSEGSGLGLPIALQVAEAHGGTIAIAGAEGPGTTVSVTLPG